MKKFLKYTYILVSVTLLAVSCQQFDDALGANEVESLTATVSLTLNLGSAPTPTTFNVKLINYSEKYELNTTMSSNGTVQVNNIIPGIYTITISAEMAQDGFTYNYSGSSVNVGIVENGKSIPVSVGASKSGALLFKEVYYCGSKTPTGGSYFRDQFYEIYNNSENVQNVRGLCIALLFPNTATATIPTYSQADAADYVYASQIWRVPNNRDYLLNPGESIIIAQMADNHQKTTLNPNSPVNLLSAEFETLVNTTSIILDNPAINMTMAFWPSPTPQWLTTVFGGVFAIYYPKTAIDPAAFVNPVGRTEKIYRVPIADVVDALELVGNSTQVQLKRLPAVLDAGAATVGGTYLGVSVARKVKETLENGRKIYFDTNNSSNDFEVMNPPVIRRNGAIAPSWNTWK